MASKGFWYGNFQEDGHNVVDTPSAPHAIFECYPTIPPTFPSDNLSQNVTPNPVISNGAESQEVCDLTSNAVINYIGQILLEEDINDDINVYQEEATIRETEKSFYDLLGKELPLSPTLTKFHPPQTYNTTNSGSSNTIETVSENDVPLYSNSEPLLISEDRISALFMENLPTTQVQMGAEEAMKFLPAVEKLFVGLEPNKIELPEKPNQKNVSENKAICYETCAKRCAHNEKEPDLSEGRSCKQQAFSSEEPARNENLDQFLISRGGEYVKEIMSVRESMKQDMKNESPEHQVHMSKKALGNKETGDGLVNLRSLLISCSEAVSSNDYSWASELINQIRKHSSPLGSCDQRVAYYLVDGLEARLVGTGSDIHHELLARQGNVTNFLKAFRIDHAICPFMRASFYFSNQTIINVSKNATKVHIIDFGIHMGFIWPSFLERISRLGSTPKIRITGVEFPEKGFCPSKLIEETGRRLSEYAQRFNIRFKYEGIASKWENIRIEDLKIEKDEILVVNYLYRLENLADETIAMSCPRDKVLRMIKEIKPRVFIHGIVNGRYSTPFYTSRFKEVLSKYSSIFDIFESTMPRESEGRLHLERDFISPKAINIIACEGSERVRPETYRQWQARNLRAGFVQLPVDSLIKKKIKRTVSEFYHKEFVVDEDNKWLLLGWKGTILYGLSTWIPNEYESIDCKTK
ncbi:scarecrow-like protein 14 [Carex rostrata]